MDKREIISSSIANMLMIYKDVGEIAKAIEQRMTSLGYKAYGDAAIAWETSTAWYGCEDWLNRWFARSYYKEDAPRQVVGYCIHLGGYLPEHIEAFQQYGLNMPILIMSSLDLEQDIKEIYRPTLYNILWDAGWEDEQKIDNKIARAKITRGNVSVEASSLAVDLMEIKGNEDIENVVIKNLLAFYEKKSIDMSNPKLLPITKG